MCRAHKEICFHDVTLYLKTLQLNIILSELARVLFQMNSLPESLISSWRDVPVLLF